MVPENEGADAIGRQSAETRQPGRLLYTDGVTHYLVSDAAGAAACVVSAGGASNTVSRLR